MSPAKLVLNGPRPSALRIVSKDSHVIQKPTSSSHVTSQVIKVTKQQRQQPVIIYTHSPKIIHTKPKDFMALVQKLTGINSRSDDIQEEEDQKIRSDGHHEENNESVTGDDNKFYVPEIPLFTPNNNSSSNLFFSPTTIFGSFSPSFLDFLNIKELPEY
ncbi:hypothetical protein M9H77_08551 [Catharanthus roseus]|uniref:Uncharacterized protein n=1 Tax=Catharanthus roseus TaxID=4058 RepID=A0ACC0BYA2_CATRO|nr:hypothetical protein M9H77_08551 [Catharanthus roseus]